MAQEPCEGISVSSGVHFASVMSTCRKVRPVVLLVLALSFGTVHGKPRRRKAKSGPISINMPEGDTQPELNEDEEIEKAAGINIDTFTKEVVRIQDKANQKMAKMCPSFAPEKTYLTSLAGEGV